jgi:hypothetical protein
LQAPENGLVDPHAEGYRRMLEAIRDDRYSFETVADSDVVTFDTLPINGEA